jgi:regulator of ribonuclease activity A
MDFKTADLCDQFPDEVEVAEPLFQDYGGSAAFGGPIATVEVFEDNVVVREALETPGEGHVLVVDGGGSLRRALLGDQLAMLAQRNGWAGVLIYGCVRDVAALPQIPIGVKALNSCPMPGHKRGKGGRDRPIHFAGVTFRPGHYLYADEDGVLVAPRNLLAVESEQ